MCLIDYTRDGREHRVVLICGQGSQPAGIIPPLTLGFTRSKRRGSVRFARLGG